MTGVNGIRPCSSLAFVGGPDRPGEAGAGVGRGASAGPSPGQASESAKREGSEVSRTRSVPNQSFLLIECLILLMMEFIKVLKKRKEFSQFSS